MKDAAVPISPQLARDMDRLYREATYTGFRMFCHACQQWEDACRCAPDPAPSPSPWWRRLRRTR